VQKIIDIAVICQDYAPLEISCDNENVTSLDEISIDLATFKTLFYPFGENFGINKDVVLNNPSLMQYISFLPPARSVKKLPFDLLETVLKNIETDLNISRNAFTTASRLQLTNEFLVLKSLSDLNCCSVVASLPWSSIEDILASFSAYHPTKTVQPVFLVSIQFKTPTPNVRPTSIKFTYKIDL
jgi:hypothetical protein